MLHVIKDHRLEPALFGAMAALFASKLRAAAPGSHASDSADSADSPARVVHLPSEWDFADYPEAVQHVTPDGDLVPSGLLWSERLLGISATCVADMDALMDAARLHELVLPLHPAMAISTLIDSAGLSTTELLPDQQPDPRPDHRPDHKQQMKHHQLCNMLKARAVAAGTALHTYTVVARNGAWCLIDNDTQQAVQGLEHCVQDAFGRWQADAEGAEVHADRASISSDAAPLRIAFIGSERDQYGGYPATLAALGDAADAAGVQLAIDFVTPQALSKHNIAEHLRQADGIVLPGGSDMTRVAGQIDAARFALDSALPAVGLCLGMQSMATAVARVALNSDAIGLAEVGETVAGETYRESFTPIDDSGDTLHHRLGDRHSSMVRGSHLHTILGESTIVRCNHRYTLNDDLIAPMEAIGVRVCARGTDRRPRKPASVTDTEWAYVDAIEAVAHPFFIGMQGHPELSSTSTRPHSLLVAFLQAAQRQAMANSGKQQQLV